MASIIKMEDRLQQRRQKSATRTVIVKEAPPREKAVTYDSNVQYVHGPGGLLVTPGVDPNLISTIQRPRGLSSRLRMVASRYTNPLMEAITGAGDTSGGEPADECSVPPQVGKLRAATLTAPFGKLIRRTNSIVLNNLGKLVNSAEPMDLRLINSPAENSPWIPEPARNAEYVNSEMGKQYFMLGLAFERKLEKMIFQGNGSSTGTGYKEFYGLDTLINTGKLDATTNEAVSSLDSLIVNWGSNLVQSSITFEGKAGVDMVTLLSNVIKRQEAKAEDTGLAPVQFALAMYRDLFWEITQFWPCQYNTNGCSTGVTLSAGQELIIATGREQTQMRDEMRNGEFLWINGRRYPVVFSDGMVLNNHALGVSTNIYLLPMSAMGRVGLYIEFFDYMNGLLQEATEALPPRTYFTSNGGLYLWTSEKDGYCLYLQAKVEPRLILRFPHLAARITNVVYRGILPTTTGYTDGLYPFPQSGFYAGSFGTSNWKIYPDNV